MKTVVSSRDYAFYVQHTCRWPGPKVCGNTRRPNSDYCQKHINKVERARPAKEQRESDYLEARRIWGGGAPITYIYIVRRGEDGPVKIGRTKDVVKRLTELQVGSSEKLKLVASFPAPEWVEDRLHSVLTAHRLNGEWFGWCTEIELLASLIREGHMMNVMRFLIAPIVGD